MADRNFIVVLDEQRRLDPAVVAPLLVKAGLSRADALRAIRRQRGILLSKIEESVATNAANELTIHGIDVVAMPDEEFSQLPRPVFLTRIEPCDDGLSLPTMEALGKQGLIPWDDISLVVAGLIPREHSLANVESVLRAGGTSHEDHEILARMAYEKREPFPLRAYLDADPSAMVNLERLAPDKQSAKLSAVRKRMRRFDAPEKKERHASRHPGLQGVVYVLCRSSEPKPSSRHSREGGNPVLDKDGPPSPSLRERENPVKEFHPQMNADERRLEDSEFNSLSSSSAKSADALSSLSSDSALPGHDSQEHESGTTPHCVRPASADRPHDSALRTPHSALFALSGPDASFDVSDLRNAGHWLRGFQYVCERVVANSLAAATPDSAQKFAGGEDSDDYLYYDDAALLEHLRWLHALHR
ncbi:MAG: hypothetical protein HUU29_08825 [Planctomycetaceae bacterium]|nr:hypothetical protein [Planctomycetaceae bacterium]